ncbi:polysaccharide deacetylase family protein [Heyndrickxia acidicola]|uniref:Polysaccharide deacetylase family protein n=1 Tax=Heyndrickxia acidicola TaxID=209389 RepID=A0ABU6MKJ9_9BACI|nr:polysaccharide deacetylase family protein [Heyndrickxia acidicola]MED1205212.1 polysaccharide deacetylase family protein [Heyndrickxia acidicola]
MKIKLAHPFTSLRKSYFRWRYWHCIYKNMVMYTEKETEKRKKEELIPYINKPGIAFSFDDSYRVKDWTVFGKELFGYYDVKVTFNINGIHPFEERRKHTQNEIDMLIELQSNGHEIAHHGFNHRKATTYSREFGIDKWLEDEVESLFHWMKDQMHSTTKERFRKPVTFAFPNFMYAKKHVNALVPSYFKLVRGHLENDNLCNFNSSGLTPSISLDGYYSCNLFYLKKIMKFAKKSGKNIMFTCHSILPEEVKWDKFGWGETAAKSGKWRISPRVLKTIIKEAKKNDLEFYTASEIAGIANFIDVNFEKAVRELLPDPNKKWIEISELLEIKKLNLFDKNISNLDGVQYFLNLEEINIEKNQISDLRLLMQLPKLKKIMTVQNVGTSKKLQKRNLGLLSQLLFLVLIRLVCIWEYSL